MWKEGMNTLNYETTSDKRRRCANKSIVDAQALFIFWFEPVMLEGLACDLFRGIAERLFFGPIVFGASLVAEASYVVERLIAIPACAFRLQRRNIFCQFANRELANDRTGGFDAVIDVFCIIHDFAIRKKSHDHNDKSIALSAARIKRYEQK
jgi:hypothetical protein